MSTLWIIPDENGVSVFFTISYKYIWTMYTTTESSKDLVDFRLVLMVVAALNSLWRILNSLWRI